MIAMSLIIAGAIMAGVPLFGLLTVLFALAVISEVLQFIAPVLKDSPISILLTAYFEFALFLLCGGVTWLLIDLALGYV